MCCVCAGVCSHIGNHGYCYAHDPARQQLMPPAYFPYLEPSKPWVGGGFITTPSMGDIDALQKQIIELRQQIAELRTLLVKRDEEVDPIETIL